MIINLVELCSKHNLKINGVVHVGAHFGEEQTIYKSLGVDNIIYFEPVKKTFDEMVKRVGEGNAVFYNCALGNDNKDVEMFIEALDRWGCSSILNPSTNYAPNIFSHKEIVKMNKLDDFKFGNVNFLNIDVQGYELEVLKGGKDLLNHIDFIQIELNRKIPEKQLDYIGSSTVDEVTEFLDGYGFKLVEVNWAGVSWGDGFYVKQK